MKSGYSYLKLFPKILCTKSQLIWLTGFDHSVIAFNLTSYLFLSYFSLSVINVKAYFLE